MEVSVEKHYGYSPSPSEGRGPRRDGARENFHISIARSCANTTLRSTGMLGILRVPLFHF